MERDFSAEKAEIRRAGLSEIASEEREAGAKWGGRSINRPPQTGFERRQTACSRLTAFGRLALAVLALAFAQGLLFASPAGALREYKAGNYDQALKDYEQLLRRKSDDPRLHFNAGTAAYRNRQLDEATRQFEAALSTPDLKLQELAYYNRGNTLYRLGEQNPDPAKKTESWERSLKDFENSLKLNPQDADAKYNHEFVKKRLEELKQQQQNQSKQDKSDQKQDKNQKQDQQQQNQQQQQSKQDQNQQQQNQQKEGQQKQNQQKQDQQKQEQQQQEQQQQAGGKPEDQKQPQPQAGQKQDKSDEKEQKEAAAYAAGQMTPERAQQLLDAQKGEEQVLQLKPEGKPTDRTRAFKDW
jgi:Ca-activated chloride channel family protein